MTLNDLNLNPRK